MGFTNDVLSGVAQLLEDAGVGTWKDTGAYLTSDPNPIFIGVVPTSPDRMIVLTAYDIENAPAQRDSVQGLQVRSRGTADPRVVDDLDDAVFDVLSGREATLSTGVRLLISWRRSSGPLGADGNSRHERSSNYALTVHRPSTYRH